MDSLLKQTLDDLEESRQTCIGFPLNVSKLQYRKLLKILNSPVNNLGDPFSPGLCGLNTFKLEKFVIEAFAKLYGLEPDDCWGYVTSSGSESNLKGLSVGRDLYPEAICYFSEATHYSVRSACELMRLPYKILKCDLKGEIVYGEMEFDTSKPILLVANAGATMTGAIDNVRRIRRILKKTHQKYYIHVDAALSGLQDRFIKGHTRFDFGVGADSICVSGHKALGIPIPCSVFITKKSLLKESDSIDYIKSPHNTIFGSRSGFSVALLYQEIRRGWKRIKKLAKECIDNAEYLQILLDQIGIENHRFPSSNIVFMKRLPERIITEWQLASNAEWSHVCCMGHVDISTLYRFVDGVKGALNVQRTCG